MYSTTTVSDPALPLVLEGRDGDGGGGGGKFRGAGDASSAAAAAAAAAFRAYSSEARAARPQSGEITVRGRTRVEGSSPPTPDPPHHAAAPTRGGLHAPARAGARRHARPLPDHYPKPQGWGLPRGLV
ncbi:Protein of unknown function [Gryllus bimaculatus]|nr:Protein of unknown function [Gryllus bimaculatus]